MMKHFFLNCISNKNISLIPIIINLRGLNNVELDKINIVDNIYDVMQDLNFKLEKEYFKYSLKTGCYLILFDGFDEVKSTLAGKVAEEIIKISNKYNENYYIVASRPSEEFIGWSDFTELTAQKLNKNQALSLIKKLEYDKEVKDKFYKELENNLYDKYQSFASTPLLLTIMLLTFERGADIPDNLNDFYEEAFTTLFQAHDASKGVFKRDIKSKLSREDFKSIFSYFCFKSYFKSQYQFSEDQILKYLSEAQYKNIIKSTFSSDAYLNDLVDSVCMLVHEGLNYRFSHRSFQEYFAALYTTKLSDDFQEKFFIEWITYNTLVVTTSNYFNMLYNLQKNRFIKNILIPGLKKIDSEYKKNNKSYKWFFKNVYTGLNIRINKEGNYECHILIEPNYYYEILRMTWKIYDYKWIKNKSKDYGKNIFNIVKKTDKFISFEKLDVDGNLDEIIKNLEWHTKHFEFALNILYKYESMPNEALSFDKMLDNI